MATKTLSFIFFCCIMISVDAAYWNYTNQNWGGTCDSGKKQSPINIVPKYTKELHESAVMWDNNATYLGSVTFTNGGHGFSVSGGNFGSLHLHGAGLKGKYVLAQFHYHWSSPTNGHAGSEHRVDAHQFPAELHLVHHHEDFNSLSSALASGKSDALAVVGILLNRKVRAPNEVERILIKGVQDVHYYGNSSLEDMSAIKIHDLLPKDLTHFYRYEGSLTTPTCNEQVVWTVLEEEMTISDELLEDFLHILDKEGHDLDYTGRDAQPIGDRTVYRNKGRHAEGSGTSMTPFVFNLAALIAIASLFIH